MHNAEMYSAVFAFIEDFGDERFALEEKTEIVG